MATEWKSQQSAGDYRLQFQTDDKEKYKLVEKAAQMAVDGKNVADDVEVVRCRDCRRYVENKEAFVSYCTKGLRNTFVKPDDFCSDGERKE